MAASAAAGGSGGGEVKSTGASSSSNPAETTFNKFINEVFLSYSQVVSLFC